MDGPGSAMRFPAHFVYVRLSRGALDFCYFVI